MIGWLMGRSIESAGKWEFWTSFKRFDPVVGQSEWEPLNEDSAQGDELD